MPFQDLTIPAGREKLAERVEELLRRLSVATKYSMAVMLALLDDEPLTRHPQLRQVGQKRSECATTQEIIDSMIRDYGIPFGSTSGAREGRDQWIDPLQQLGVVERAQIPNAETRKELGQNVVAGWPVPQNAYSGYRVSPEVRSLLARSDAEWRDGLEAFLSGDELRRLKAKEATRADGSASEHNALIAVAVEAHLAEPAFAGFKLLYGDLTGGHRVTDEDKERLAAVGIRFAAGDRYPDGLLADEARRLLWVIEAVESDGEVDPGRVAQMREHYEARCGWQVAGFTTAYATWAKASGRQGKMRNLAVGSYLWIRQDGGKFFRVEATPSLGI